MREDFIAQLDPYLALIPKRLGSRYRLDLLGAEAAQAAARRPAEEAGVDFTPEAAARLVDDLRRVRVQRGTTVSDELGPYVEPVQLQVVCRQLWATLPADATAIETGDVAAVGNVDDALADFYVELVKAVAASTGVTERALRAWFDERLITEQGFRTQVHEGPGDGAGPEVLRELEDAHLIRADRRRGTDWYELAHDRLVAPIRASNEAWQKVNLSPLQLEAQLWEDNDRKGHLMTGEALAAAETWAANHVHELLAVDRDYLDACRAEHVRAERERRASRRNKVLAVVASVVGVLALVVGALALVQSREAKRQEDRRKQSEAGRHRRQGGPGTARRVRGVERGRRAQLRPRHQAAGAAVRLRHRGRRQVGAHPRPDDLTPLPPSRPGHRLDGRRAQPRRRTARARDRAGPGRDGRRGDAGTAPAGHRGRPGGGRRRQSHRPARGGGEPGAGHPGVGPR